MTAGLNAPRHTPEWRAAQVAQARRVLDRLQEQDAKVALARASDAGVTATALLEQSLARDAVLNFVLEGMGICGACEGVGRLKSGDMDLGACPFCEGGRA